MRKERQEEKYVCRSGVSKADAKGARCNLSKNQPIVGDPKFEVVEGEGETIQILSPSKSVRSSPTPFMKPDTRRWKGQWLVVSEICATRHGAGRVRDGSERAALLCEAATTGCPSSRWTGTD